MKNSTVTNKDVDLRILAAQIVFGYVKHERLNEEIMTYTEKLYRFLKNGI